MRGVSGRSERARALWRARLASALRTALACAIVVCVTLYGPAPLRRQVSLPAFSYVTVILIVTEASLGDTLRGCWLALYATAQSIGPATLSLWLIGPARLSSGTTALAVALASFMVALPEATHGTAKRIALGQIVLVYVIGYIEKERMEAVMHPLHVAASTAVGALACPLALSLPFPRTACHEIKENCQAYAENASNRLKLFAKAFLAEDDESALAFISQTKCLSRAGNVLLRNIKRYQGSALWERVPFTSLKRHHMSPAERLQESLETHLRGMDMALTSIASFPVTLPDDDGLLKNRKLGLDEHITLIMRQSTSCLCPGDSSSTVPESISENITGFFEMLREVPTSPEHLPSIFFLFCMKLLDRKSKTTPSTSPQDKSLQKDEQSTGNEGGLSFRFKRFWNEWGFKMCPKRLVPAFKCSLSLGLAVVFGLLYSKEDGYWAGLPIALSYSSAREATFKAANVKAQGMVLGTVYGVLGCFLFQRFMPARVLSLVPWFVFCSFLRKSKMYGQAGGVSAVIGAVLILGRKNFGRPTEFAITRIVETFIGLSCSIVVELLMQPTRASSRAKRQLTDCFGALRECIVAVTTLGVLDNTSKSNLEETQTRVRMSVLELGKCIEEADVEPSFWFMPFHSACYGRLLGSLSKMVDLLHFSGHALKFLEQESSALEAVTAALKEALNKLHGDLELFGDLASNSLRCFEEINSIKSLSLLEKQLQETNSSCDLELGKATKSNLPMPCLDDGEVEKMVGSYLQHSREVVDKISGIGDGVEAENAIKSEMVLSLGALGYCMSSLLREAREIEKAMKELVQWDNPASQIVSLHDLLSKVQTLHG